MSTGGRVPGINGQDYTGKWHHLLVSYDENASDDYELTVYLTDFMGYTSDLGVKV